MLTTLPIPRTAGRPRGGFTLLELLIVIGVIALLLGVLLPGVIQARRAARAAGSVAKAHAILNATSAYALDDNGFLPATNSPVSRQNVPWTPALARGGYVGGGDPLDGVEAFIAPGDPEQRPFGFPEADPTNFAGQTRPTSFGLSLYLDGQTVSGRPRRLAKVADRGDRIILAELADDYHEESLAPMIWGPRVIYQSTRIALLPVRDGYEFVGGASGRTASGFTGEPDELKATNDDPAAFGRADTSAAPLTRDEVYLDEYDGPMDGIGQQTWAEELVNEMLWLAGHADPVPVTPQVFDG